MNDFIDKYARTIANTFAFVMTFLMLWFVSSATAVRAGELAPPSFTQRTFLFWTDAAGTWHNKVVTVPALPNALAVACFKMKDRREAQCMYVDHGTTGMLPTRLVGEETS